MVSAWDVSRFALLAVLLWTAVARGAVHGWPLALAQLLTLFALGAWLLAMLRRRALEWRPTALDVPLALLFLLVVTQIVLGNESLRAWALAPPTPSPEFTGDLPARFWFLGTVAPPHTSQALGIFAMHVAVYVLVVNLIRERRHLQTFIRILLLAGAVLAFAALLDYMVGEHWVVQWRELQSVSRLSGTFNNPDHFAAWLTMLVCLGIGTVAGSRSSRYEARSLAALLASRDFREDVARRYLPLLGVVLASLAVLFTLSRGGIVSLLIGLGAMLVIFGRLGWMRRTAVLVGSASALALIYAAWIGLGPLVARLSWDESRWLLARATLPMLARFPLFGTGLGSYGDIFNRYQTAELQAGRVSFPDAHNDVLQLVVETGIPGALIAGYMAWRVVRDLLAAHVFGRGRCPVGGGGGELAQRHDPFSVGLAVGALGAIFAFGVHCLVEFPARIPANGVLAAACLGIATVALHTRFDRQAHLLTKRRLWSFRHRRVVPIAVGLAAAVLAIALVPWVIRPALIEAALVTREGGRPTAGLAVAFALDPKNPEVLARRANARAARAEREGQVAPLTLAIDDFRASLAVIPSNALIHERLGWAYDLLATLEPARASEHVASAVAHLKRAIFMAPEDPWFYRSLAAFGARRPETLLTIGLEASRGAAARDPTLLPDLVERFDYVGLTDAQWTAVVPPTWPDRLDLARLLEARGRFGAAEAMYRAAIEVAPPEERPIGVWMLAGLLLRKGDARAAAKEIERALPNDPHNPELLLTRAQALESLGDPAALAVYRAAVEEAATLERDGRSSSPFTSRSPRIRSLVVERTGVIDVDSTTIRYRRALARYLLDRRLWAQAGTELDVILSRTPKDPDAHFFRAVAWEGWGMPDRALERYREAIALSSQPRFRLRLARLLWDTEKYFQAMNEWRAVLAAEPDNVEARLGLAQAHLKEGDRLAAFHQFQRVLKLVPDQPVARREIDRLTGAVR
jgi:tetratricopeptide (TPR) repeat protein/O-antigen ligase